MFSRTSLFAFSASILATTSGCGLGAEPSTSSLPPPWSIDRAAEAADGDDGAPQSSGLPDEGPLTGIPAPDLEAKKPVDPPTAACDLAKPFGALAKLPFSTSAYETGGRLSADELTFYFSRKVGLGNMQPFVATRPSKDAPWGEAAVLSSVDSPADDGYLTTSKDELVGFFASTRIGNLQIHKMKRASATDAWGTISVVTTLGTTSAEDDPFLVASGKAIYFDSNRGGAWSIYRATIDAEGNVEEPVEVAAGTNAVVTGDELTMYRSRGTGGQTDILVAKRAAATDPWSPAAIVDELFSAASERATWVSEDGCRIIIATNRAGGEGSSDLYLATKPE